MDWLDDLEFVIARTGNARFRVLCGDDHPDRDAWRARVAEMRASLDGSPPVAAPSLLARAGTAAAAAGRALSAAMGGAPVLAGEAAYRGRLEICGACEHWTGSACRLCGCATAAKLRLATERCPDDPPRWPAIGGAADPAPSDPEP